MNLLVASSKITKTIKISEDIDDDGDLFFTKISELMFPQLNYSNFVLCNNLFEFINLINFFF